MATLTLLVYSMVVILTNRLVLNLHSVDHRLRNGGMSTIEAQDPHPIHCATSQLLGNTGAPLRTREEDEIDGGEAQEDKKLAHV